MTWCPVSGPRYFDPYNPRPEDVDLDTIAFGLKQTPGFRGYLTKQAPRDQHCLRVQRLTRPLIPIGFSPVKSALTELVAITHDAHEAYTPWGDCPSPCKTDWMRAVESGIDRAIFGHIADRLIPEASGLDFFAQDVHRIVKQADALACYFEAMLWQPGAADWTGALLEDVENQPDDIANMLPLVEDTGDDWTTEVRLVIRNLWNALGEAQP